jgi:hypothetical protein
MAFLSLLLLPPLAGFGLGCIVWGATDDREIRQVATVVIVASVLLAWAACLLHLCGLAENRSELYDARCGGGTPDRPLLGIPVLMAIGLAAIRWRSPLWWLLGLAAFLGAIAVPWQMLSGV